MAVNDAVKQLANTVTDLAQQAVDQSKQRRSDTESQAASKGLEMISQAAQEGFKMVADSTRIALDNVRREANPLETLDAAANVLKKINGGGGGESQLVGIFTTVLNNMQQQNQALQQQVGDLMREMRITARTERNGSSSLVETAKEFLALRDMLDNGRKEEDAGGGGWAKHIPAMLGGLGALAGAVAVITHNLAVARTGQGAPINPADVEQMQNAQQQTEEPVGELPAPEEEDQQEEMIRMFLSQVEAPLRAALEGGLPGGDFAASLIAEHGRAAYKALVQMGGDTINGAMRSHPPLAVLIDNNPRWPHFLQEFLTYTEKPTPKPRPNRPATA